MTNHRNECDKLSLNWTLGEDIPEGKVVRGTFKHYLRVKAPKGCGSSTWREYTFLRAQPLRLHARDMMRGCSGCTRVPISPCLGTHLASPVHSLKLDRAKTKAQADSSPAAEDEQGGPSLVDDE